MRYSANRKDEVEGAIMPVVWYLLNLLVLPIISFAMLVWIAMNTDQSRPLRRAHARAGACMSVLGAFLIISGVAVAWAVYGNTGNFWTVAIVWAIVLHTSFVLWGMIALAQAIGGKRPYFPKRLM
jgi:uncharacterized membrane protein